MYSQIMDNAMQLEEIRKKYDPDYNKSVDEIVRDISLNGLHINDAYAKHLEEAWVIQSIWGHQEQGFISNGKARELTAYVIEYHNKQNNV